MLLESDYNTTTTGSEVAEAQMHLLEEERSQLGKVNFSTLATASLMYWHEL